jgi:protocatechuate 3,4-dioxygenase beta subunit
VAGLVYWDADGNRLYTPGKDPLLAGAQVTLSAGGATFGAMTTASDGAYRFAGLDPQTYKLAFRAPAGYALRLAEVMVPVQANRVTALDLPAEMVNTPTPTYNQRRVYVPLLLRR